MVVQHLRLVKSYMYLRSFGWTFGYPIFTLLFSVELSQSKLGRQICLSV